MIRIRGLKKEFQTRHGRVQALRGIDLEVQEREFCVVLGPSGCGKTTALRCVAGLEKPDAGEIEIGGALVSCPNKQVHVPPEKRDIGMVFQSYAIWPHMNVFQNVAFALIRGRKQVPRNEVTEKVRQVLRLVRLEKLEERAATDLSGGQQQRVAMARALVTEPEILLMDEPLSNLDARLREEMRLELKKITRAVGITTLYVTHDQAEALTLGDKVCVMNDGEILQIGKPREVYSRPSNLFVAQFFGEMNLVPGKVVGAGVIDSPLGRVLCTIPPGCGDGREVTLAIRPEHLNLLAHGRGNQHAIRGKVLSANYLGDATLFEIEVGRVILRAKVSADSDFNEGEDAVVGFPPDRWLVYPVP